MAYRRKQGISRSSTFKEGINPNDGNGNDPPLPSLSSSFSFTPSSSSSSPLAAQVIKASTAHHHPSLSLTFAKLEQHDHHKSKSFDGSADVSKSGVWGVLAQKAKEILEDDKSSPQHKDIMPDNLISQTFNSFALASHPQEGVENKTRDPKTPTKLKGFCPKDSSKSNQASGTWNPWQQQTQTEGDSKTIHETQLKASRDVAMATAAKAKLLLRELKTVKADLAFSKARCAQLEEENKMLRDREGNDKGQNVTRADDDLIRLQLETLLAEKGRLASENEVYARENRFLREVVEYHQLTMQDLVYLDDGIGEAAELYPLDTSATGVPRVFPKSPRSPLNRGSQTKSIFSVPHEAEQVKNVTSELDDNPPCISVSISKDQHAN